MLAVDNVVQSRLWIPGETALSKVVEPIDDPRAALVFTIAIGANVTAVGEAAYSYGGVPMALVDDSIRGTSPWPWASIHFLDDVEIGPVEVTGTKHTSVSLRFIVVTILADGAVVIDDAAGGSGANSEPAVPSMTATAAGIAFGLDCTDYDDLPTEREGVLTAQRDEGEFVWDLQRKVLSEAGSTTLSWVYGGIEDNARVGVILRDPNPAPPPSEQILDFEDGLIPAEVYQQAIPGRLTVVDSPVGQGKKALRVEVRDGDKEPDTGSRRAELSTERNFYEGEERTFQIVAQVDSYDAMSWHIPFQLHDQAGGSPPLALLLWHDEDDEPILSLQHGDGSNVYWTHPGPEIGEGFELIFRAKFHPTEGEVGDIIFNGEAQEVSGGGAVVEGKDTAGALPLYSKIGCYEASTSSGTTLIYIDLFRISETPIEPTWPFAAPKEEAEVVEGNGDLRPPHMPHMTIPKLRVPLRLENGRLALVEQDSQDNVAACVYALLATERGSRLEDPDFGVEDPTFDTMPIDVDEWLEQIAAYEPRAEVRTSQEVGDLIGAVLVEVGLGS